MGETLVIVDDNESFRAHARTLLGADGYEVLGEAADGASGLEAVRRLEPDIALLDVQLPDTSGFALAEDLRTAGSPTVVVMISTREECDYAGAVAGCGAAGFISKSDLCAEALHSVVRSRA